MLEFVGRTVEIFEIFVESLHPGADRFNFFLGDEEGERVEGRDESIFEVEREEEEGVGFFAP